MDSFTLPASQFGLIWDAFFDRSPQNLLLKGYLAVQFTGFNPDNLPVALALDAKYQNRLPDFIKQSAPADINKTVEFRSDTGAYDPAGPRPIKRMLVSIDNQTIELDKEHPVQSVNVKISVLELILHPDKKLVYHYDLQIIYVDGGKSPTTTIRPALRLFTSPERGKNGGAAGRHPARRAGTEDQRFSFVEIQLEGEHRALNFALHRQPQLEEAA